MVERPRSEGLFDVRQREGMGIKEEKEKEVRRGREGGREERRQRGSGASSGFKSQVT